MTRVLALLVLLASCGGASVEPARSDSRIDVRIAEGASVAELAAALTRALEARGHEGECFLAWDAASADVTVRIGERARSAALSCGGLAGLSRELEGRCPAGRVVWAAGRQVAAMSLVFGAAGDSFAGSPLATAAADSRAADAVFFPSDGGRLVLAVPLDAGVVRRGVVRGKASKKQAAAAPPSPLEDPQVQLALRQLVARVQRCNPSGQGSLVLEWLALPDGTLTSVRPLTASVGEDVVQCARDMVAASRFPEREGEPLAYCTPVLLAPALRPAAGR